MEKILTIVVPTYNMEAYLDECLSSMIMEDMSLMEALEVIVVNDGSKDNSLNIALSYKERFPNTFVVIDKENGNYGSCVNRGLKEATGKYFRIVDADDWVDTTALQEFLIKLSKCASDLVFTKYVKVHETNVVYAYSSRIDTDRLYDVNTMKYHYYDAHMQMHGMTYKTSVLKACDMCLLEGVSYTDAEYCFYPLSVVNTVLFYDIILYHYRADRDGQTMSASALMKSTDSLFKVSKRIVESFDGIRESNMDNARTAMRFQVSERLLKLYYYVVLHNCHKLETSNNQLKEIYEIVMNKPLLIEALRSYKLNKVRFVKLWEDFGIYNSSPIFMLYNSIYAILRKMKLFWE